MRRGGQTGGATLPLEGSGGALMIGGRLAKVPLPLPPRPGAGGGCREHGPGPVDVTGADRCPPARHLTGADRCPLAWGDPLCYLV
jgi:hypothetical protein